jgi:hypothetical protein
VSRGERNARVGPTATKVGLHETSRLLWQCTQWHTAHNMSLTSPVSQMLSIPTVHRCGQNSWHHKMRTTYMSSCCCTANTHALLECGIVWHKVLPVRCHIRQLVPKQTAADCQLAVHLEISLSSHVHTSTTCQTSVRSDTEGRVLGMVLVTI